MYDVCRLVKKLLPMLVFILHQHCAELLSPKKILFDFNVIRVCIINGGVRCKSVI